MYYFEIWLNFFGCSHVSHADHREGKNILQTENRKNGTNQIENNANNMRTENK